VDCYRTWERRAEEGGRDFNWVLLQRSHLDAVPRQRTGHLRERNGYKASRHYRVIFRKDQSLRLQRCWMIKDELQGEQRKAPRGLVSNGLGGEAILLARLVNREMCA
jgi:hypothetical protein